MNSEVRRGGESSHHGLEAYLNIASVFSRGMVRIWEAEFAGARLLRAANEFRSTSQAGVAGAAAAVLQHLTHIPNSSLESLRRVANVSHLIYSSTLFDTFLSETTRFLLLLTPHAIGEDQRVSVRALLDVSSRYEAITAAAHDRASQLGSLTFIQRIDFLRDVCGLAIALPDDAAGVLAHFSTKHNSATHDQGSLSLRLNGRAEVLFSRVACSVHPELLNEGELHMVLESYEHAARAVAEAVFTQILQQGENPAVQLLLKGSTAMLECSSPS